MVGPLEKKGHARELVIRYLQSENYPSVTKAEQFLNTLKQLVDMSFDPLDAFDALKETDNNDVEQAREMLFKIKETKANLLALNDEQLQTTTRLTIL